MSDDIIKESVDKHPEEKIKNESIEPSKGMDEEIDEAGLIEDEADEFEGEIPEKRHKGFSGGRASGKVDDSQNGKDTKVKNMKTFWIITGSIVAFIALVYIVISVFFMSHFFINTVINGQNFTGKTASFVEAFRKDQVKDYELTVLEKDNKSDTISGNQIGLKYKPNGAIKKALKKQNGFMWPASLFTKNTIQIALDVSYDQAALDAQIQKLQAVTVEQIPAKSAHPKFDGENFIVEPEVIGTSVDMKVLKEKVARTISQFGSTLDMAAQKCYSTPKFTSQSPEVTKACDTMNSYCKASITYPMTEPVVVDKALISTWLSVDDNMNVSLNEEAIKAWLTGFGDKYDTVGTTRTITSPTGKTVQVSGGTYGWSINEDKELQALTDSIKKGETVNREPVYYQTAAAHAPADWGNTYAEVDLTAQHMWFISNGAVQLETDVVTGYPVPDKETPVGVYSILEIQKNKTLVGDIKPDTGKPEYETPVSFWMRVTWSGIGFHDATWQPAFGGSLYQIESRGSHGCINMPYDKAQALFGMLSVGTPVIIHD